MATTFTTISRFWAPCGRLCGEGGPCEIPPSPAAMLQWLPFQGDVRQNNKKVKKIFASPEIISTFAVPFETERDFLRPRAKENRVL